VAHEKPSRRLVDQRGRRSTRRRRGRFFVRHPVQLHVSAL